MKSLPSKYTGTSGLKRITSLQYMNMHQEISTLGGGCFWCIESIYIKLKGVISVESGYTGGTLTNPTYEDICSGTTGHAEVVQIIFAPSVTTFEEILQIFFSIHDPTTPDRQGNDVGNQYRSAIFYHSDEQKRVAEKVIHEIETAQIFSEPIVTEISPLSEYYPAEEYHQDYYQKNPSQPYCQFVIEPKVAKFRNQYFDKLKK